MKVWNVTPQYLEAVARTTGVELSPIVKRGRALQFTLRPKGEHYRRRSPGGRRIAAVCWHGHRDFFRTLFYMAPGAKVSTALTRRLPRGERFYTAATFADRYRDTDHNIGSMMAPARYSECCDCDAEAVARWALTAA